MTKSAPDFSDAPRGLVLAKEPLENELGRQLNLAGAASVSDAAKVAVEEIRIRITPLRRVQRVKHLYAELHVVALVVAEVVVLKERQVHAVRAGTPDIRKEPTDIAQRERRRSRELRCVEPLVQVLVRRTAAATT